MYIYFANAGATFFTPFDSTTLEQYETIFNTDVKGTLFAAQKAFPVMRKGGSIVLNGSIATATDEPAPSLYSAS